MARLRWRPWRVVGSGVAGLVLLLSLLPGVALAAEFRADEDRGALAAGEIVVGEARAQGAPQDETPDADDDIPGWAWAAVGGVVAGVALTAAGYKVWLDRRS